MGGRRDTGNGVALALSGAYSEMRRAPMHETMTAEYPVAEGTRRFLGRARGRVLPPLDHPFFSDESRHSAPMKKANNQRMRLERGALRVGPIRTNAGTAQC